MKLKHVYTTFTSSPFNSGDDIYCRNQISLKSRQVQKLAEKWPPRTNFRHHHSTQCFIKKTKSLESKQLVKTVAKWHTF